DGDLALAVQAAAGGDAAAVAADGDAGDPAGHSRHLADQVRVVADGARRLAEDPVDLRAAVRAADDDLIPLRVAGDGGDAALQGARGDRGDVVHEALRGDLGQLGGHVAPDGDQVRAVGGEDGVQGPVTVRAHKEDLLAGLRVDGAHAVVGAAEGDAGAVRR